MASSIRILSSTDVDKILSQLDIVQLIDVHTATLFRTLALANAISVNPDGSKINDPEPFVHSPHRLAVRAGSSSRAGGGSGGGGGRGGGGRGGGLYTTLVMPSSVANYGTTVKLISLPNLAPDPASAPDPAPTHASRGLPATTVVVDERTGAIKAVVNSRALNIRTALGSMLATKLLLPPISDNPAIPLGSPTFHPRPDTALTRNRDAPRRLVLYGAGLQVRDHAVLLLKEYHRSIQHVSILNRSAKAGSELLSYLNAITHHGNAVNRSISSDLSTITRTGNTFSADTATTRQTRITDVKFELFTRENESEWENNWATATRAADIICMATPSTSPVLKEEWVKPGQHFILVGSYRADMAEVPTAVIRRASKVVVDSRSACQIEAGELIAARLKGEDMIELGELVDDRLKPRAAVIEEALRGDVTIWKSVGLAPQDSMIATVVVERAEELGVGTVIEDYDRPN